MYQASSLKRAFKDSLHLLVEVLWKKPMEVVHINYTEKSSTGLEYSNVVKREIATSSKEKLLMVENLEFY